MFLDATVVLSAARHVDLVPTEVPRERLNPFAMKPLAVLGQQRQGFPDMKCSVSLTRRAIHEKELEFRSATPDKACDFSIVPSSETQGRAGRP